MSYCPIHNHSEYSALDGLSTTKEIAVRCQELGYEYVGLTDHGTVAGHLDFSKTMREAGIKPIFGCELYHGTVDKSTLKGPQRDQAHFIAGALTSEGLRNLWRLTDSGATLEKHHHVPRIFWEDIEKYSEGLFATSACILGHVVQELKDDCYDSLNRYLEIFKDDFYIELHCYPTEDQQLINQQLVQVAEEKGIPMTIATDAHYASPDQYETHDAYLAAKTKQNVYMDPADRKMWHPKALYIKSVEEIKNDLFYLPESVIDEALQNNESIGERSTADLPEVKRHLPAFIPSECEWVDDPPEKATTMLVELVEQGIVNRYGEDASTEVWDRAAHELEVFINSGLEDYFLQTWDFCQFCEHTGIFRGPGRGSAPGAIISYALGITDIDPIHYDLKFERFYNAGREKGLPDIDNDIPRERRADIKKYLAKKWGEENVRSIGNIGRMKPLKACDTTWGSCDIPFSDKNEFKKILEKIPNLKIHGPETVGWDAEIDPGKTIYVMDYVGDEIDAWKRGNPKRERWVDMLRTVCSRVSQYGVHASGVVVSDVPLNAELPSRWASNPKIPVTSFPMNDVDARQFLKQDLLGLRNLDTLEQWAERWEGEVTWSGLDRQDHPEEMWQLLDKGFTAGIFQVEDGYARQLCKRIKPRSIADIGAIVALNRPGPRQAGTPDSFMDRREGLEPVVYDHPILEDILEPTYGLFLYQEQVIDFMTAIGYSPSDSDAVRKILGKKKPEAMRDLGDGTGEWKDKGYMQMAVAAGIDIDTAETIWEKLKGFADYSFNKSHAFAYAVLTLRTLYAKFHGTAEFIIALINTDEENKGRYIREGRRMGIEVKGPDISRSDVEVEVIDGDIVFGFSNIKHIGKGTAKYIIDLREKYPMDSPEALFRAIEDEWKKWDSDKTGKSPRQKIRANLLPILYDAGCWDAFEDQDITLDERQRNEMEYLSVVLSDNSDEVYNNNLDQIEDCDSYSDVEETTLPSFRLPGRITSIDEKKTKAKGEDMGVVTIEYEDNELEFVVFPRQWQTHSFLWKERTIGIFEIKRNDRGVNFQSGVKLS